MKFKQTIISYALAGYETGYSQLGTMHFVGYLPSHIQQALKEKLLIIHSRRLILVTDNKVFK